MTNTGIGGEEVWFKVVEEKNTTNNETHKRLPDGIYRLSPSYSLLRPGELTRSKLNYNNPKDY